MLTKKQKKRMGWIAVFLILAMVAGIFMPLVIAIIN